MPPKHNVDPKKIEAERLSGFLQELLREEENKYCADCEAKQPRWASWNLGVFLCIRCAGLHRNLGVHISKVKSVNLDSWTAEQVQSMRVMGNAKAKAVFEAELPQLFRRPQSDQTLEAFIRAKYEARRYILRDWCSPPVSAADLPERAGLEAKCGVSKSFSNSHHLPKPNSSPQIGRVEHQPSVSAQVPVLIDFSSPPPKAPTPPPPVAATAPFVAPAQTPPPATIVASSTIGGDTNENLDELFGPIVSAPSAPPTATSVSDNKKSKADILALFGNGQTAESPLNFHLSNPTLLGTVGGTPSAAGALGGAAPSAVMGMGAGNLSTPAQNFGGGAGVLTPNINGAVLPPNFGGGANMTSNFSGSISTPNFSGANTASNFGGGISMTPIFGGVNTASNFGGVLTPNINGAVLTPSNFGGPISAPNFGNFGAMSGAGVTAGAAANSDLDDLLGQFKL